MFRRLSEPLPLSEASLLALRPALNAPVLNIESLPVGPARAAIVVFAEEYGGIGLALGVRSDEGGQVAVFRNQEPIEASTKIADALEPALANAERMGFLFDEDIVENTPDGEGRALAMALWGRLMGELDVPAPGPGGALSSGSVTGGEVISDTADRLASSASSAVSEVPELLLDDLAALELEEISLELDDELMPAAAEAEQTRADLEISQTTERLIPDGAMPERPAPAKGVAEPMPTDQRLSKFRNEPAVEAGVGAAGKRSSIDAEGMGDAGSELGRIPLVRVRREGTKRLPFLARLLSSF